jgi:hypothetical protein
MGSAPVDLDCWMPGIAQVGGNFDESTTPKPGSPELLGIS